MAKTGHIKSVVSSDNFNFIVFGGISPSSIHKRRRIPPHFTAVPRTDICKAFSPCSDQCYSRKSSTVLYSAQGMDGVSQIKHRVTHCMRRTRILNSCSFTAQHPPCALNEVPALWKKIQCKPYKAVFNYMAGRGLTMQHTQRG